MVPQGKGTVGCCPLSEDEYMVDPKEDKEVLSSMLDFINKYAEYLWKQSRFGHCANYVFALRCLRDGF